MSKSGKWLLIFGITALVSAILFGITVAAFGVKDGDYGVSVGGDKLFNIGGISMGNFMPGTAGIHFRDGSTNINEDYESNRQYSKEFAADELDEIKISLASCAANIKCGSTDKVTLNYTTGNMKVSFSAEMNSDTLTIEEKPGSWFNFGSFKHSTLDLTIPEKLYRAATLDLASGSITASGITSKKLGVNVASGGMELGAFADDIEMHIASGRVKVTNCTENAASSVRVEVASGNAEMNDFKCSDTRAELASGTASLNGISGNVRGQLASGKLILNYAEWNGDLDIGLASGKADVTLPQGSGVNVKFERASGSMKVDLDGHSASIKGESDMTVGGSNVHNVDASVLSGNITIHN